MTDTIDSPLVPEIARPAISRVVVAWLSALLLVASLLVLVDFHSRDPDSALHAAIIVQSYQRPVAQWIAPGWNGQWGRTDLYREHPAGIFLLPSALARAGYPAEQAPYVVNAVFQILTIFMVARFAALVVPAGEARALSWILLLLPIAFTYRIRANHEQAVLLLTLVALDASERARHGAWWPVVIIVAAALTFLVKGAFALPLLVTCAVWLSLRPPVPGRRLTAWGGLALAAVAAVGTAAAYELAYHRATDGDTFLGFYFRQQLGLAALSTGVFAVQKLINLAWYTGRLLWFAAPWSVLLVIELFAQVRRTGLLATVARDLRRNPVLRRDLLPVLAAAATWPLMFSLSDRRADRYIFPAYYLFGAAGAVIGMRRFPPQRGSRVGDTDLFVRVRRGLAVVERAFPFEQVVVWLALTLSALSVALLNTPGADP